MEKGADIVRKSTALLATENVRDTRLQAVRAWTSWMSWLSGSRWDTTSEMNSVGKTSGVAVSLRAQIARERAGSGQHTLARVSTLVLASADISNSDLD